MSVFHHAVKHPNFGGVAERVSSAYSRGLVLDREVEVSAPRNALPHIA